MTTRRCIQPGDGDPRHGTANGYANHGCRCEACRVAWRTRHRADRVAATAVGLPPDDPRHGTVTAYSYWGCRCSACTEAHRHANRAWRTQRKERAA